MFSLQGKCVQRLNEDASFGKAYARMHATEISVGLILYNDFSDPGSHAHFLHSARNLAEQPESTNDLMPHADGGRNSQCRAVQQLEHDDAHS